MRCSASRSPADVHVHADQPHGADAHDSGDQGYRIEIEKAASRPDRDCERLSRQHTLSARMDTNRRLKTTELAQGRDARDAEHLQMCALKNTVPIASGKMHVDEIDTDAGLVQKLLAAQFPQWADMPLEPLQSSGTDNALYRLGDDKVLRLPRIQAAAGQVDKEDQWLPRLAPLVTLPIPVPLAKGTPGEGFPWSWSVYRWIEGETATIVLTMNTRTQHLQQCHDMPCAKSLLTLSSTHDARYEYVPQTGRR